MKRTARFVLASSGFMAVFTAFSLQSAPASSGETLEGWFNLSRQWGGTIHSANSKYAEGDTIPLRFTASLSAGSSHTVLLKYDFSTGGPQRFFDSIGSYNVRIADANPTAGISGAGVPTEWPVPADSSLPSGAQLPGVVTTYNIATLTFGSYTAINGVKAIPVTFTVSGGGGKKTVILAYGGHLASESIWGLHNGASQFPGASTKAFASLDGRSDANVSVNPGAVVGSADVSISKTAAPDPVLAGENLAYTLTVANPGPDPATSVVVTDTLPAGTTLVSASASQGTISGAETLSFAVGTLEVGASATLGIVVSVDVSATASIINSASVSTATLDPNPANNNATATTTVTPRDRTPPVIVCPAEVVQSTDPGLCAAAVHFTVTATDDNEVVSLVCIPPSGSVFPKGTTTVTCTATDAEGNSGSCSFSVTVNDTGPPHIVCPADIVTSVDAGRCDATVSFPTPAVTDNCPGTITVGCNPPSGSVFPIGDTIVTCTASDASGNTSTCAFKVTVQDTANVSWPQALPLLLTDNAGILEAEFEQCINQLDQSRWFRFGVEPGSKVFVILTGLAANYDLVLFKDIGAAFIELTSQDDLVQLNAEFASDAFSPAAFSPDAFSPAAFSPAAFSPAAFSPAAFSPAAFSPAAFSPAAFSPAAFSPDAYAPAAFSPAAFSPAAFSPAAFSPAAFSPAAFSPAAFSSAQTRSVIAVSAFDGLANEGLVANTWDNAGDFYIRVRGRNGVFSLADPFQLHVFLVTGACGNVVPLETLPASSTLAQAGAFKTIILTDVARMAGTAAETSALQSRLAELAARPEVAGVVMDVGSDARVAAANAQADANFDCPFAKNVVALAIKEIIDRHRALNPLEYVVLVGNDGVIPFFRHPDQALLGPERNYVPPVKEFTASQASLRLNYVLSQDGYGSRCDLSLKSTKIPLPDLAVGRLVETPGEVVGMIDAYLETLGGVVPTPTSALVTGYDFLQDTADAVRAEFEAGLGTTADALILDHTIPPTSPLAWTADDLRTQLLGGRHDLIFLAGHFSAVGALAADYSTHLLATELAEAAVNLKNAILFSAGCHSGYSLVDPDAIPIVTLQPDWAQACARKQLSLVAGTGYQYGDTDFIEYSERIYLEFSRQLRTGAGPVPIGKALVRAKETYLAATPQMRGIHEKAFLEATLFGLPMLSVNMPGQRLSPSGNQSIVGATQPFATNPGLTLGLAYADVTVTPSLTAHQVVLTNPEDDSTVTATYLSGGSGLINNPAEPILPLEVANVSAAGTVLRGVGFRGGSYTDTPGLIPLTGAATTEIRGVHATFLSDVFYPIRPWLVNYFDALCDAGGGVTRLMVIPAQFLSSSPIAADGTLRSFGSMDFRLYYSANTTTYEDPDSGVSSTPGLAAAPSISAVSGVTEGGSVLLSARAHGNPAAGIQEVWVTCTALSGPYSGQWQSLDLTQNPSDSTLWEGTLPLDGTDPADLRYIVQAVNGVGLVALDTKLGAYHVPDESDGFGGAPTVVALLAPTTAGAYGTVAPFSAQLTSNGSPLANRRITFSLGDQEVRGITDLSGVATINLNLLNLPGVYELKAAFAGAAGFEPSFASSPFTVTKQGTAIALEPPSALIQPNVDSGVIATLQDAAGGRLVERTVVFVVTGAGGSYARAAITDFNGRARLGPVPLPDGAYTIAAYFNGTIPLPAPNSPVTLDDDRYEPSSASSLLVVDSQPPTFSSLTATPNLLRPPNHRMVKIKVDAVVTDLHGPTTCRIVSVTSNEPVNGTGDGDQEPDWLITDDLTLDLRAERAQNGTGRTYTITVECRDALGNTATGVTTVFVPK